MLSCVSVSLTATVDDFICFLEPTDDFSGCFSHNELISCSCVLVFHGAKMTKRHLSVWATDECASICLCSIKICHLSPLWRRPKRSPTVNIHNCQQALNRVIISPQCQFKDIRDGCSMYVGGACIPEGVGFPCDSNQEKNKDGICFLGKHQNLISQLSCGVRSGQEERENRNSFSLSVGLAAVSLEDPTGQQRQEEQGERKIYKKKK